MTIVLYDMPCCFIAAAMEPAEDRPDDSREIRGMHATGPAAMEPAEDRPDDDDVGHCRKDEHNAAMEPAEDRPDDGK